MSRPSTGRKRKVSRKRRLSAASNDSGLSDESMSSTSTNSSRFSSASSERQFTSQICNLIMPVPRVKAMLKVHNYAGRVSNKGAVYLTAILEYVTTEIIELSLNAARDDNVIRIKPKHVNEGIKTDPEFFRNFRNVTVVNAGIVPYNSMYDSLIGRNGENKPVKTVTKAKKPASRRRG